MRIAVDFQDEQLEFEIEEDRLVGQWSGPAFDPSAEPASTIFRQAIESPCEFPPLNLAVVPGDRVVVPLDPSTPELTAIFEAMSKALRASEVEEITVVSTAPEPSNLPEGVAWRVHDPDDPSQLAYLSSTKDGRRVYLNKYLTDADIVVPIGTLGYDGTLGYRGPWSVIFPGLSDRETLTRYQGLAAEGPPDREKPSSSLLESSEVGWLLGCQFQIGVLAGHSGVSKVIAGLDSAVMSEGAKAIDDAWTFRVDDRADVVVVGIGEPHEPTTLDNLALGILTATRLVRRGGKIVALSKARFDLGPSLKRLRGVENPRSALNRLRGREADPDFPAAKIIAEALGWADVYLHSAVDSDLIEDLALIPLDRPSEALKLASHAPSVILVSQADRTRALVVGE
jgi:hypothetical protein